MSQFVLPYSVYVHFTVALGDFFFMLVKNILFIYCLNSLRILKFYHFKTIVSLQAVNLLLDLVIPITKLENY
jgi:hypothetical protein